jgi:hypothetical protein
MEVCHPKGRPFPFPFHWLGPPLPNGAGPPGPLLSDPTASLQRGNAAEAEADRCVTVSSSSESTFSPCTVAGISDDGRSGSVSLILTRMFFAVMGPNTTLCLYLYLLTHPL